jgi:hypothetical protein
LLILYLAANCEGLLEVLYGFVVPALGVVVEADVVQRDALCSSIF